jgi:membrane-bound serine protease (ClpP class)
MLMCLLGATGLHSRASEPTVINAGAGPKKVYVLPIREDIGRSLLYLVRRGVKEAMEAKADLLVIDMETNGGDAMSMMEVIESLNQFKGQTATFVNTRAFSAGALISFATQKIFMAPDAVIGAAAPVAGMPGGGTEAMPDTMEAKTASALSALVRVNAEKNGHNVEVVDAMMKKTKELKIDGKVLNEKGQVLTLTAKEAATAYGDPPKPLLSAGTVENMDELVKLLGFADAARVEIKPTGAEKLATWINAISPLLLIIGVIGIYIEFKTPGFGLPGIIGITAFAIYFLGSYVAGLSGMEWIALFVLGLLLVALELFVFQGTVVAGLIGAALMLTAIVMAMVDVYPGMPTLPQIGLGDLRRPVEVLLITTAGAAVAVWVLSRWLPKTSIYHVMVSRSASGVASVRRQQEEQSAWIGLEGMAVSNLRPGGKAQFGEALLDVMTQGEMIDKGRRVRIVGHSAREAIVEAID